LTFIILFSIINLSISTFSKNTIDNNDICWGDKEVISSESIDKAYRGIIQVDGDNNIHVAWKDQTNYLDSGDDWDVFYKMKPVGGNWTNTEVVSTESSGTSNCPNLIVDNSDVVHIVWSDSSNYLFSGDDLDIFHKIKLVDNTWTKTEVITLESENESLRPQLGFDSYDNVYLVWEEASDWFNSDYDTDIFLKFKKSDDDWSDIELVSSDSSGESVSSSISVGLDGSVHVVWTDSSFGDFDVFYNSRYPDGVWSNPELVSSESLQICNWPRIDVDDNNIVHVIWTDETVYENSGYDSDIIYKYKRLFGNWSYYEIASFDSSHDSFWPWISVEDNGFVHISWWDDKGDGEWVTYYKMRSCIDFDYFNESVDNKDNDAPNLSFFIICSIIVVYIFIFKKFNI
jgi:hypothetical protein